METIELSIVPTDDGLEARIPVLGRVSLFSTLADTLTEGTVVGQVTVLRQVKNLALPSGGPWVLRRNLISSRSVGVGVGTPLLALRLWDESAEAVDADASEGDGQLYASPMAGQYYRRPAPDQPPFIEVGDVIEEGTQLGLVEVMKFFYPLVFEGRGRWRITELVAGETISLEAGDPVIRIERSDD